MKLHLFVYGKAITGYTNVCPAGGDNTLVSRLDDLEGIVEAAECTEILADDITDFIPANKTFETLKYYVSKLRHNGKIIIGGTDLNSVAKNIITKRLNPVEANHLLYGTQGSTWEFKSGMINLADLTEILRGLGISIVHKRVNGNKMVVEGFRP
jgi:hypothetical protein